jgi:hypothetical protein
MGNEARTLDTLLHEERRFEPPAAFRTAANWTDAGVY